MTPKRLDTHLDGRRQLVRTPGNLQGGFFRVSLDGAQLDGKFVYTLFGLPPFKGAFVPPVVCPARKAWSFFLRMSFASSKTRYH